jgi:hypothetical protein
MKTVILSLIGIINTISAFAQCSGATNLIPNPSFETNTASCTGTDNQLYSNQSPVASWFGTEPFSAGAGSTPDYSNNNASACGVNLNALGQATCFVGNRSVGLFVYTPGVNGREYVQSALNSSLVAGQLYCFSMRVRTNTMMGNNTDGIGAHFRNSGVINITTMNGGNQFLGAGSTLNMTPQVQQTSGAQIGATCTIVTGTFTAAGGENRVIIGNFKTNAATSVSNSSNPSYMIIDDVRLFAITPLPVSLSSFNSSCSNNVLSLDWSTEFERNNDYFTIEQSCDGEIYETVETINGSHNSEVEKHYSFQFEPHCSDFTYIRLTQTDTDGNKTLLSESINSCEIQTTTAYYNDLSDQIILLQGKQKVVSLRIFDMSGKLVADFTNQLDIHEEKLAFTLSLVNSGFYHIVIEQTNGEFLYTPLFHHSK